MIEILATWTNAGMLGMIGCLVLGWMLGAHLDDGDE